jgi:hypothetical protein
MGSHRTAAKLLVWPKGQDRQYDQHAHEWRDRLTYRHIRIKLAATSTENPAFLAASIGPSV